VTLVAKQPDPAAQSNGSENINLGMQLTTCQNDRTRYPAAVTALAWCD